MRNPEPTTSSLVGPQSKSESFFTATERFCRWSSGDPWGEVMQGTAWWVRGLVREGQGPHGAKKRHLHSTEGPECDPATHFVTVHV